MFDNKTVELLGKALIGVGLGYLAYAVATMPKEVQDEVKKLANTGAVNDIKKIVDAHQEPQEEVKHEQDKENKDYMFLPIVNSN